MKQLDWIDDGYSEALSARGLTVVFRPMLWHERQELWRVAQSPAVLAEAISSRIVAGPKFRELDDGLRKQLFHAVCRPGSSQHIEDESNLRTGVRIEMLYPHLSRFSCADCKRYWFDPETGVVQKQDGKLLERLPDDTLMCQQKTGCIKGTPERQRTLSPKNRQAWRHYLECRAVGQWPDDPIVRRNAFIIGGTLQTIQREINERRTVVRSARHRAAHP